MKSLFDKLRDCLSGWFAEVRYWCRERSAFPRLPLLGYLAYAGYRQFREPGEYSSFFSGINLCIHEGGHLMIRPLGNEFLGVAGGTALQLAVPLICILVLLKQRDYFGIPICLGWLSTNLIYTGVYMADARAREMPLLTMDSGASYEDIIHDWAYLFGRFNLLEHDTIIGFWTRMAGTGVMILALATGSWMLALMLFKTQKRGWVENGVGKPLPAQPDHRHPLNA